MLRFAIVVTLGLSVLSCESDKQKESAKAPTAESPTPAPATGSAAEEVSVAKLSVDAIADSAGTEAKAMADGVVRIGWARDDVPVAVDGAALPPSAGLGSWAAFAPVSDGAMVMGDTVVFEDEINPAIDAAFANGLQITALHNHFAFDDPAVYFMHIGGKGDPAKLAAGVKAMWDAIRAVRKASPKPARTFPGTTVKPGKLDPAKLASIVGHDAQEKPGGVVKVVIERNAKMGALEFGGTMGLATWAAFHGDESHASIDGDFAMTAGEVQTVLRALRAAKINIVALHNHMIGESPAYYFVHFWGKGPAAELARGFRSVLDAQAQSKARR
jgi:hypothetical protein